MKQLTFTESQWALLSRILMDAKVHEWNQWSSWKESESGILSAGMEPEQYQKALKYRWERYTKVFDLCVFFETNSRIIEDGKA